MIPLELTIEGLYSYQKRQTIDFTKLTSAGLFGIFGMVGSGKSSILEAITFAIYGKTDKLNQSGDNRNYNMMNLKSNELLIDFTFEAGKDQTAYRSIVKGRRNSKRFDDVKTFERKSYVKIDKDWVPTEAVVLENAVGLSYENFKRTIIIPQGQFQEFLQLGNKDRTQMMKELFNLQKFEFYYKVVSLETKNNNNIQKISGQLQQLGTISPELVEVYQKQLLVLENSINEQKQKLALYQKEDEQQRGLLEKIQKRNDAERVLNSLLEQQPKIAELEKRVERYEQSVTRFKYILNLLKENRAKEKERREQILSDSDKLKIANESIEELVAVIEKTKPQYDRREELKRRAEELNNIIKIKIAENRVKDEANSVYKGNKYWEETNELVVNLKSEREDTENKLVELRASMPDFTLLSEIKSWYNQKHNLEQQIVDIKDQIEKFSNRKKELITQKENLLKDTSFDAAANLSFTECNSYLDSESQKIKINQTELIEYENHLLVKAKLESFAKDLDDNTPCPLCGSLHHPDIFKSEDLKELEDEIKINKLNFEKQQQAITSISKQLSNLEGSYNELKQRINELHKSEVELNRNLDKHLKLFVWNKYSSSEELNKAFSDMELIQNKIKSHEAVLSQKVKELNLNEKNLERARIKLEDLRNSVTKHKTEILTLQQQLQIVKPDEYQECSEEVIIDERVGLLNDYTRIEKEYNIFNDSLQEKIRERERLKVRLETNNIELNKELLSIEELENKINKELVESDFKSIEEVNAILSYTIDVSTEKQKIEEFKNNLLECKSAYNQYQKDIGNTVYDSESHEKIKKEIDFINNQVSTMNKEHGGVAELLNGLLINLESQQSLRNQMESLEIRADYIKTMKSLFKASGFVNYISSVYLQNLCKTANKRFFQLTRQKLSLEIGDDNNFKVRDFMNGGKERSVKTLSGGQTFQASLSLALALADNIQKITESNQNFFFLDEGFGSLDKESLNIVFDTLKSLRKENRIVGVISHVEEMQQEIETHLHIDNHDEKGSIIHSSWSNNY